MIGEYSDTAAEGNGSVFGAASSPIPANLFPKETELKLFTGNIADDTVRAEAEAILTKSLRCQGYLKKKGDLAVIANNGTFDKLGEYHIYLYYAYMPVDLKKKKLGDKPEDEAKPDEAKPDEPTTPTEEAENAVQQ